MKKSTLGLILICIILVGLGSICVVLSLTGAQWTYVITTQSPTPTNSERTATAAAAYPNPYAPGYGFLTINDPLNNNSGGYAWMDYNSNQREANLGCEFKQSSYTVNKPSGTTPNLRYCLANNTSFQNFTYQITMLNTQGSSGGIIFREVAPNKFYYFSISTNGHYSLWLNTASGGTTLAQGFSQNIYKSTNQLNTLAVVAMGSTIDLYVNYALLATVQDTTYELNGKIGTAVGGPDKESTECEFTNARVWAESGVVSSQ